MNKLAFLFILLLGCQPPERIESTIDPAPAASGITLQLLGTIQDAGSPHIGCDRDCCRSLHDDPDPDRMVVALGLHDATNDKQYLFEATPDMPRQLEKLSALAGKSPRKMPDGVFLTHAHIGHYSGLMYFGKEAINADGVPVYAMPRMREFLNNNGPWSQLVSTGNIELRKLADQAPVNLSDQLTITPLRVPHRDEFSETVGYRIQGPDKSALFIPDIDKWKKWERNIIEEITRVDYAFLDATFFSGAELNHRDISQIPHPFIIESLEKFKDLPPSEKSKIIFIHFNHTNPVLDPESEASRQVAAAGLRVGKVYERYEL